MRQALLAVCGLAGKEPAQPPTRAKSRSPGGSLGLLKSARPQPQRLSLGSAEKGPPDSSKKTTMPETSMGPGGPPLQRP
eukprot:6650953-Lingulodinium_polyedra.AAC.1